MEDSETITLLTDLRTLAGCGLLLLTAVLIQIRDGRTGKSLVLALPEAEAALAVAEQYANRKWRQPPIQ